MFPLLHQELATSSVTADSVRPLILSHLTHLKEYFSDYFPELDNAHFNWIRNPFESTIDDSSLDLRSQEELIEISNEGSLKMKFSAVPVRILELSEK